MRLLSTLILSAVVFSFNCFANEETEAKQLPQSRKEWRQHYFNKAKEFSSRFIRHGKQFTQSEEVKEYGKSAKAVGLGAYDGVFDPTSTCIRMENSTQELINDAMFMGIWDEIEYSAYKGDSLANAIIKSWSLQMARLSPTAKNFLNEHNQFEFENLKLYDRPTTDNFAETAKAFWRKEVTFGFANYRCFRTDFVNSMDEKLKIVDIYAESQGITGFYEHTIGLLKEPKKRIIE